MNIREVMKERKYSLWEQIISGISKQSNEWRWASQIERMAMQFDDLTEEEKTKFFELVDTKVCGCPPVDTQYPPSKPTPPPSQVIKEGQDPRSGVYTPTVDITNPEPPTESGTI